MMTLEEIAKKISEASSIEMELVWIPKIMGNQTSDEVEKLTTNKNNGIGLNKGDSYYVTRLYNQVKSGGHLSDRQTAILRKILPKYKKQYRRMVGCVKHE